MSKTYWANEGIGIDCSELVPYLSRKKIIAFLRKLNPEYAEHLKEDVTDDELQEIIDGDFDGLCKVLAVAGESSVLVWAHGGEGGSSEGYLLYPPKYPWNLTEDDPKTEEEARELIKKAVRRVCEISEERLDCLIDFIYEVTWN